MSQTAVVPSVRDRIVGALFGQLVGDCLGVPVHWYYSTDVLQEHIKQFYNDDGKGTLTEFHLPNPSAFHPDSFNAFKPELIEEFKPLIIANFTRKFGNSTTTLEQAWNAGAQYHCTLELGENTIGTMLSCVLRDLLAHEYLTAQKAMMNKDGNQQQQQEHKVQKPVCYTTEKFVTKYMEFFTTPLHHDFYIGALHRNFFKKVWANGADPMVKEQVTMKGNSSCNADIAVVIPAMLFYFNDKDTCKQVVHERVTHFYNSDNAVNTNYVFVELFHDLLSIPSSNDWNSYAAQARKALEKAFNSVKPDSYMDIKHMAAPDYGKTDAEIFDLYFSTSWYGGEPGALLLAYKYFDTPEKALIANVNLGGDTVHRNSVLGAIMGCIHGTAQAFPQRWTSKLANYATSEAKIEAFADAAIAFNS